MDTDPARDLVVADRRMISDFVALTTAVDVGRIEPPDVHMCCRATTPLLL